MTEPLREDALPPCPECGGRLMFMEGDGVRESCCTACGFVTRQHPGHAVPHEAGVDLAVASSALRERYLTATSTQHRGRRIPWAWMGAGAAALWCVYLDFAGADSYVAIHLADIGLSLFAIAVAIWYSVRASRRGLPFPDTPFAGWMLYVVSVVVGFVATGFAPTIGEGNYCFNTTVGLLMARVPRVFRCTYAPFFWGAFVLAYVGLGALAGRWSERRSA